MTIANVVNRTVTISNFQAAVVAGRSSRCGYHGWHVLEPDAGTASGAAHSIVAGVQVTELLTEKQIAAACKLADSAGVSWHNFRYTFSTWANPTGESIKALQSQLGYTDSRLTLSVGTPIPEAQKQLSDKVARVLLPVAPKLEESVQMEGVLLN